MHILLVAALLNAGADRLDQVLEVPEFEPIAQARMFGNVGDVVPVEMILRQQDLKMLQGLQAELDLAEE